ncbi:hypothetical protein VitviT2T_000757 [Vitis vinifera]|uniref:Uncharacterized protein n=1 Tax=Vitis vinifera TaxID=29760 RepID=A0ABY9BDM4_VITVI|nr:hypothetical protein VitviT2T_000757 [Vitis vinifera]
MSAEQNSGCETSGKGGTSADRIPDVRHPEKVGLRSDRIPDVRHPEKVGCRRTEFRINGDAPFVIVINTLMGSGQFLLINRLCVEDDVRTHTKTQTSAMASTGFTRKPAGLALGPGEYTTLA